MDLHISAKNLLTQLDDVIHQLDDVAFRKPLDVLSQSSIGQHIRHTLEFFLCLMDGAHLSAINYDDRKHDKEIENDPSLALRVSNSIQVFLDKHQEDFPLDLLANYTLDEEGTEKIPSSFYRELAYNIEHAIHHMALIKIGTRALDTGIKLPPHFGVASSTVRYQSQS